MSEEGSRGSTKIEGRRAGERRIWNLGPNYWGIEDHPNFHGQFLSFYRLEEELVHAGRLAEAVDNWQRLAHTALDKDASWLRPWLLSHLAEESSHRSWDGHDNAYGQAIQAADAAAPFIKAQLLKQWAATFQSRDNSAEAAKLYDQAISEYQKLGNPTMAMSNALKQRGAIAFSQGDFSKAEDCFHESISLAQEVAPSSVQVISDLIWLGALSQTLGNLAAAETSYQRALTVEKASFPESQDISLILEDLGTLASRRGDLAKAEEYFRAGLIRAERLGSKSLYLPDILSDLAECLLDLGHPNSAEGYEKRALAIREKGSAKMDVASSLRNLGKIARLRGRFSEAERYYLEALTTSEAIAPESLATVRILIGLGYVARDEGDFVRSANWYRRALVILDVAAPGSLDHAETLADLAGAMRGQGDLVASQDLYKQATAELEGKTASLGGTGEDRSRYRALHDHYYRDYVDLLVQEGHGELGLQTLESLHAHTLLEMLFRSQIDIRQGVDSSVLAKDYGLRGLLAAKMKLRTRLLTEKRRPEDLAALDLEISNLRGNHDELAGC